jgi:hypothetical protein
MSGGGGPVTGGGGPMSGGGGPVTGGFSPAAAFRPGVPPASRGQPRDSAWPYRMGFQSRRMSPCSMAVATAAARSRTPSLA